MDNNQFQEKNNTTQQAGSDYKADWDQFRTPRKPVKKNKGLKIFLIIFAVCLIFLILFAAITSRNGDSHQAHYDTSAEHISVIDITGTIENGHSTAVYETSAYNQTWLTETIDSMIHEPHNRGILLYLDTPGGSVYATDEVYLKLLEYKEITGNPVYAAMGPTCASGGYYIACAADKAFANRNTITGSIGVTMGTHIDISQLLKKYGIETTDLVSGANKAMGNLYDPLTDQQKAIYQSIIDESYEQFTGIVAKGRQMELSAVKKLADGRVYTAQQAADNGLIDGVLTYEETLSRLMSDHDLYDCAVYRYSYSEKFTLTDVLFQLTDNISMRVGQKSDLETALEMAESAATEPYYILE